MSAVLCFMSVCGLCVSGTGDVFDQWRCVCVCVGFSVMKDLIILYVHLQQQDDWSEGEGEVSRGGREGEGGGR